eukprot:TRINITY_DN6136_c0_g1_i8.p1 TRINITY_DN6136_c0_g1~~TRINITY_DN6136_c0_g1_i8.p1  ORF type:complete len:350 (-),score=66.51 TRINITY_DN6136_c0_g1_i8:2097-3146(-)
MGVMCVSEKNDEASLRSREIEKQIRADVKTQLQDIKLLLLGAGDSGKSTFAKQMRILHKKGLPIAEYTKYQTVLRENTLMSMVAMLNICEVLGVVLTGSLENDKKEVTEATELTNEVACCINRLWESDLLKRAYDDRSSCASIQILSSAPYFFTNAERFASESFRPNDTDVTMAKLRTTGVIETNFSVNNMNFTMVDVGGQRSERRKWLHCFDNVTAVIYLAALDEYNMTLEEDNSTNRLDESLRLFGEVVGSPWFSENTCILFLNKFDLFTDKIKKFPLSKHFNDISPSDAEDYDKSVGYIQSKYEKVYGGAKLYVYTTCAVDKSNCERVFNAVRDAVLSKNVELGGI